MSHIHTLLIANRGEIACRIQRSAHAMGVRTVAVYTAEEADAPHVRMADAAVVIRGSTPTQAYLDVAGLVEAAVACGANAVHPGYGFLSERDAFAQAVLDAGLIWVGPPPQAMRALGGKAQAKQLALAHGVPCLPGYSGADQSDAMLDAAAQDMGYPIMIKAVAGGGGRGMRLVTSPEEWAPALAAARSEGLSAFGCADVLLERALLRPRHIEVQVVADQHGNVIHLGERECSLQRRHQKVVEEAPSPLVDVALRTRMGEAAVRLAQAAGYVGVGTVEFLVEPARDDAVAAFYFMEMNTRLQVEHPVTEMVTGIDLVEWQLRVAQGQPLPLRQDQITWTGHAVEVRLCAEDDDFMPHTGEVMGLQLPQARTGLRLEHALVAPFTVSPHFDSMLGKWIAHAPTRDAALQSLRQALGDTAVLGLPTNRAALARILAHPDVVAGHMDTHWLERYQGDDRAPVELQHAAAQAMAVLCVNPHMTRHVMAMPYERPVCWQSGEQIWRGAWWQDSAGVRHARLGACQWQAVVSRASVAPSQDQGQLSAVLQWHDGETSQTTPVVLRWARLVDGRWHGQFMGGLFSGLECWLVDASMQPQTQASGGAGDGVVRAPFNGKVLRTLVSVGDAVSVNAVLLVLESMKLEHSVCARTAGVVAALNVSVGQQVSPGQVIAHVTAAVTEPVNPISAVAREDGA